MEIVFELILEFILEAVFEILTELGLHSIGEPFRKRENRNPFFAVPGYLILGLITGGISLLFFRNSFFQSQMFPGISLILIPLLGGAVMSAIGMLRRRRGKALIQLDSFAYGAIFAFGMALVRFLFTS